MESSALQFMGDSYIDAVMDQTVFGRLGDKIMA